MVSGGGWADCALPAPVLVGEVEGGREETATLFVIGVIVLWVVIHEGRRRKPSHHLSSIPCFDVRALLTQTPEEEERQFLIGDLTLYLNRPPPNPQPQFIGCSCIVCGHYYCEPFPIVLFLNQRGSQADSPQPAPSTLCPPCAIIVGQD